MKTSILDAGLVDDVLQKDGAWQGLQRVRLFGGVLKASDDKRGRWFSAGTDGCTDALDGEREREKRAGAGERDAERQNLLDAAVHLSRSAATPPPRTHILSQTRTASHSHVEETDYIFITL